MSLELVFNVSGNSDPKIKALHRQLKQLSPRITETDKGFLGLNRTMIGTAAAFYAVKTASVAVTNSFIKLENAQIGVRKTTGLAGDAFEKLDKNLQEMATTMSGFELAGLYDIAESAGQLGIQGVKDISEFTRVISMVGLTTDLSAKEAGSAFAKLSKQLQEPISNTERLASVFNELSNTTAANVGDLLVFAGRMSGAGKTVGLTTAEIVGLSATLADLGVRYEVGGSAINRTMMLMASDSEKFAKAMGKDSVEFASMVENEPIEALTALLETMESLNASDSINLLKKVGLGGVESSGVLLKVANSTKTLTKNLKIANDEYRVGTSMQLEYETASIGLQAQNTKLGASFELLGSDIGEYFKEPILEASEILAGFLTNIREFIDESKRPASEFALIKDIQESDRGLQILEDRLDQTMKKEETWFDKAFGTTKKDAIKALKDDISEQKTELDELTNSYIKYYGVIDKTGDLVKELASANLSFAGYAPSSAVSTTPLMPDYTEMDAHVTAFYKHQSELQAKATDIITSDTDKINAEYLEMYETIKDIFDTKQMEEFGNAWSKELNDLNQKTKTDSEKLWESIGDIAQNQLTNSIQDAFDNDFDLRALEAALAKSIGQAMLSSGLASGDTATAGAGLGLMAVGSFIGADSGASQWQENMNEDFNNFLDELNKASLALENFGNIGSSFNLQIAMIESQILDYTTLMQQTPAKLTDVIDEYSSQISTLQDDINALTIEAIAGGLDFSRLSSSDLQSLVPTQTSGGEVFSVSAYEDVLDQVNDLAILAKQQEGGLTDAQQVLFDTLTATGSIWETGQDWAEVIDMVDSSMQDSIDNTKTWTDSFLTADELAQNMATTLGVDLATSMEMLNDQFLQLANDTDGLTDADLDYIEAVKTLLDTTEDFSFVMESMTDSIDDAINAIRGNTLTEEEFTVEEIKRLNETQRAFESSLAGGDTESAQELLAEITALSTGISAGSFGDTTAINENLISSLEANKAMIDWSDEIIDVNIVGSDITEPTVSESTALTTTTQSQVAPTNDRSEIIEKTLTALLISNKNMEDSIDRIENTNTTNVAIFTAIRDTLIDIKAQGA